MKLPEYHGPRWISTKWAATTELEKQLRTLRFPPEIEREFAEDYFENSVGQVRIAGYLVLFLILIFGLTEIPQPLHARNSLWILRYGVSAPFLVSGLAFSYTRHFKKFMQPVVVGGALVLGLTSVSQFAFMSQLDPILDKGILVTLITLILSVYTLSRLRLMYAIMMCWTLMGAFTLAALAAPGAWNTRIVQDFLALLMANLLGMAAGHSIERYIRRDFLLTRAIEDERQKSERLLLNVLPQAIAERLKQSSGIIADSVPNATVLFADIQDFTPLSARLGPEQLVTLLNELFSTFDRLAEKHGLEKIKSSGDSYMVVGGLPTPRADHAEAVADLALDMQDAMTGFTTEDGRPLGLRIGIHTGPVVAGVIGTRKFAYDLWGDTVNTASRMQSHGLPGRIQTTAATVASLSDEFAFECRGELQVKGRGAMTAYLLNGRKQELATLPSFHEAVISNEVLSPPITEVT